MFTLRARQTGCYHFPCEEHTMFSLMELPVNKALMGADPSDSLVLNRLQFDFPVESLDDVSIRQVQR